MQSETAKTIAVFVLLISCSRESLQSASFQKDESKMFGWSEAAAQAGVIASIIPAVVTSPYLVPGLVITGVAYVVKEGVVAQHRIDAWKEIEQYRIDSEKEIKTAKYKGAECIISGKIIKPDGTVKFTEFISKDKNECAVALRRAEAI